MQPSSSSSSSQNRTQPQLHLQPQPQQTLNRVDINMNMNMMNRATHAHANANTNTNPMTSGMEALMHAQQMHARHSLAQAQQQQMFMYQQHQHQHQQNPYAFTHAHVHVRQQQQQQPGQRQGEVYPSTALPMNMSSLGYQSQYELPQAMVQAQGQTQRYDNNENGGAGEIGYYQHPEPSQQQLLASASVYQQQQPQGLKSNTALTVAPAIVRQQHQYTPMNLMDAGIALKLKGELVVHQQQQQASNANINAKVQEHPLQYKNRKPGTFSKQMAINSRNSFQALLDLQKKSQGEGSTIASVSPQLLPPPTIAGASEPSVPIELNGLSSSEEITQTTTSVPTTAAIQPQLPQYHRYNRTLSSLSTRNPLITRSILNAHSKAIYESMAAKQAKVKRDKFAAYSGRTVSVLGDGPKPVSSRLRSLGKIGAVIFKRRKDPLQFPTRAKADALLKAAVAAVEASDRAKKFAGVESSSDSPHLSSSVHSSDNEIHTRLNSKALDNSNSSGSRTKLHASVEIVNIKQTEVAPIQRPGVFE